ncbi:hypothetical protein GCM10027423_55140 [Spirosoma arcticum]
MRLWLIMRLLIYCLLLGTTVSFGQPDRTDVSPYRVRKAYELTGSVLFIGASYVGFRELDRVATLSVDALAKLSPGRINAFDRPAIYGDPARFPLAQKRSDRFLNIAIAAPVLLAISPRIRKDWLDLLTLYAVTHSVNNLVYFATAFPIRRARPLTYSPTVPLDQKTGQAKTNSFYSGHVSFSATATFFGAKVLTDYHHITGWKRVLIFAVAAVPPALVSVNRIEAGKHFRTDVLTGFIVGGACGIGVPELHKRNRKNGQLTGQPYLTPFGQGGIVLNYRF